jgi:hypothetical protein
MAYRHRKRKMLAYRDRKRAARASTAASRARSRATATKLVAAGSAAVTVPRAAGSSWRDDPALAVQVEEALATITLKRRRFLLRYLESGNARQSVLTAGYNCTTAQSADEVAKEILATPNVQHAYQALLEATGLGLGRLHQIHALHLSRHTSPDGGDRDRSLRALNLAYKHVVPKPPIGAKPVFDEILDEMTSAELLRFAEHREWPARFAPRLRAHGWTVPASAATRTNTDAPDTPHDDPFGDGDGADWGDPTDAWTPPPDPNETAPDWPSHLSASEPGPPPPRPPMPSRAPDRPTRFQPGAERPEDRVWPPIDRPATLADDDRPDEPTPPPRDWYKRDCRW